MSNTAIIQDQTLQDFIQTSSWLFDAVSSAIVVLNNKGYIVYSNSAFEKIANKDNVIAAKYKLSELMPGIRALENIVSECLQNGLSKVINKTIKLNHIDSQLLPICITINPLQACPGLIVNVEINTELLRNHFADEKNLLANRIRQLSSSVVEKTGVVHSLFDKSPVGMMVYDSDGLIIKVNSSGRSILDAGGASLVGKSIYEFYDRDEFIENLNSQLPSNLAATSCSGTVKKLLRCSIKSEFDESYFIETFVDVTEMEQARIEIEKAKIAADQANAAKTEFLANMSHELRTPMHGIIGFSQLGIMEGMALSADTVTAYFEKIYEVANQLLVMLNDLLDIAKMESEQVNPKREPINIDDVVELVGAENQALLDIKSMDLKIENRLLDKRIMADQGLIKQVLRNIIVNAINYSPAGSNINIILSNEPEKVKIQVIDQGPGIPELEKESIFEKFVQSSFTKDGSGGSGLGLAICKRIILAHKGEIWAENNLCRGSMFVITLPQSI